jgi:hypothetical protein
MFIQLSDPAFAAEFVRFFQAKDYFAVEEAGEIVLLPLQAMNGTSDRSCTERDLDVWRSLYPAVDVEIVGSTRQ